MNTLSIRMVLSTAVVAAAPAAHAASDYLLEIDGIKGESQSTAVMELQWLEADDGTGGLDLGRAPTLRLLAQIDPAEASSSTYLQLAAMQGRSFDGGVIFAHDLTDAKVENVRPADRAGWSWLDLVGYSTAALAWWPPMNDGSRSAEPFKGAWDTATGNFTGDRAVFGVLDELQATRWSDGTVSLTAPVPEPQTWALWLLGGGLLAQRLRRSRPDGPEAR